MIDLSSLRSLQPGALAPGLVETNILDREAVRTALQDVLAVLGGRRRDVAAILPDACCRVVLIDLDVLPESPDEADALIRYRLKKSLPFDVEKARVSWQVQHINGKISVLAAVTLTSLLEEYESVVREAGCSPGLVLPSILASLRQVDAAVPTLLLKVNDATTSVAIMKDAAVVLVRVLDRVPGQRSEGAQLADDAYPSLMFFQDVYGSRVQRILVSGVTVSAELHSAFEESTGVRAQQLVGAERLGGADHEPSVLGAVAGALA